MDNRRQVRKRVEVNQGEVVSIELKNKIILLKLTQFDTDIDTDQVTQIQYHNIMGEILTSSVILNRIGNLKADIENIEAEAKLDFEIFFAQKFEEHRKSLLRHVVTSRSDRYEEPTNTAVEQAIIRTPEYKVKRQHLITLRKNCALIESLYWSLKDKCEKINKLSDKLRPDEFEKELLEESINGVMIITKNKAIQ